MKNCVRSPKISSDHHKNSDVKDAYDFEENSSVKFKRKQTLFLNWYFIFIKHELTKLISKHKYGGKNQYFTIFHDMVVPLIIRW